MNKTTSQVIYYRYEGYDFICLYAFPVIKYTPKGVWIDVYGDKKLVLINANKQYACDTIECAKISYIKRKER